MMRRISADANIIMDDSKTFFLENRPAGLDKKHGFCWFISYIRTDLRDVQRFKCRFIVKRKKCNQFFIGATHLFAKWYKWHLYRPNCTRNTNAHIIVRDINWLSTLKKKHFVTVTPPPRDKGSISTATAFLTSWNFPTKHWVCVMYVPGGGLWLHEWRRMARFDNNVQGKYHQVLGLRRLFLEIHHHASHFRYKKAIFHIFGHEIAIFTALFRQFSPTKRYLLKYYRIPLIRILWRYRFFTTLKFYNNGIIGTINISASSLIAYVKPE